MSRAQHLATISRQLHDDSTKLAVIDRAMAGMSYSQISADLEIPRGMVSGIVYRARRAGALFPNQKSDAPPPPAKTYARKPRVKAGPAAPTPRVAVKPAAVVTWFPKRLTIMELRETSCRWPTWANNAAFKDKLYCGLETLPGLPYCAHCRALSISAQYTKDVDRRLNLKKLARSA